MITSPRMKWFGLALLGAVQFMVVLDIAIVNVALPSIQTDLGFSQANLQWVISAYALVFGGFLPWRPHCDLLGRRRIFMHGPRPVHDRLALCGLAWDDTSLIGARAIQGSARPRSRPPPGDPDDDLRRGPGAEHRARRRGAVGGFGAAAGVLLGGSSPTRSRGSGSSSSTSRSASPRSRSRGAEGEPRHAREVVRRARRGPRHLRLDRARARDHARERVGLALRPHDRRSRSPRRFSPASSSGRTASPSR